MASKMCDFITIPRSVFRDESLDDGKYSRREAFLYLIQRAVYQAQTVSVKGGRVELKRGQLCASVRYLADIWGWSKDKVSRTLSDFVAERRIDICKDTLTSVISIVNYDLYQPSSDTYKDTNKDTCKDDEKDTDKDKYNKDKKDNKENKESRRPLAESVDRIYKLYPSSTRRPEGNTVTLKTAKKNKAAIERMLASKEQTEESLSYIIRRYLEETTPEYLQRFETFLNQLPDYDDKTETPQESPDEILRKAANPTKEQIQRWFKEYFVVIHPKEDGEDREHYWGRMRETYEKELGGWIERRVEMARQKLL